MLSPLHQLISNSMPNAKNQNCEPEDGQHRQYYAKNSGEDAHGYV
jgi:hypothetical protein